MVTVLSSLPDIRALPFAVCLSVCLASSTPLRAAEQGLSGMQMPDSPGLSLPQPAPHRGIDAVFADRWDRPDVGYAFAADGRIRPVLVANVPAEDDAPTPFTTKTLASSEESQLDIPSDADADVVQQKCGPSPMTASEIARLVVAAAEKHGVDPKFALAVATTESRLDRLRNSPQGARGPMQLMPTTAERFGVDDICDPVSNIDGGVQFLRELFDTLENPLLVAAAYNAGEARVREYGGIPPFPETLGFVAEVVNRQLGLPEGNVRDRASSVGSASAADNSAPSAGVITTTQRRQWVGGVMHF